MTKRNTIQRDIVLNTVIKLRGHVTADEVYESIKPEYPNISRGTVYRNLKVLSEEGKIRRVEVPNGSDRFDFTTKEHYHVRCISCGDIADVDMDILSDLTKQIRDSNGMNILGFDILFKGICRNCQINETEE